jgi:O-acetylserine/cysteine efflux transporter
MAAVFLGEKVRLHNVIGIGIGVLGLAFIAQGATAGSVPALGLGLTLLAALSWAAGNIVTKGSGKIDMLALVVWGALVPPLPFFALSWIFEGPGTIRTSLSELTYVGVLAVFYLAVVATLVGYVLWGRLLSSYPASKIAPLSLLVPIIGLLSSAWFLDERLAPVQWLGGAIVMLGLTINVFGLRVWSRWRPAS